MLSATGSRQLDCFVLAMNDPGKRHVYPARVRFEIAESDIASYRRAADFLNVNTVDVACVQHEYGIFGGKAGNHVLALLRELRMPIVSTLAYHPRRAESASSGQHGRAHSAFRAARGHERAWRIASLVGARRRPAQDRSDSARHPQCGVGKPEAKTSSASRANR